MPKPVPAADPQPAVPVDQNRLRLFIGQARQLAGLVAQVLAHRTRAVQAEQPVIGRDP